MSDHVNTTHAGQECHCKFPLEIRVLDVVVTPRLRSEPHLMTVDRHCDCLLCGPHVVRMRVIRDVPANQLYRGKVIDNGWPAREANRT